MGNRVVALGGLLLLVSVGCGGTEAPAKSAADGAGVFTTAATTTTTTAGPAKPAPLPTSSPRDYEVASFDGYAPPAAWQASPSIALGGPDKDKAIFRTPYTPWTMARYQEIPTIDADGNLNWIGVPIASTSATTAASAAGHESTASSGAPALPAAPGVGLTPGANSGAAAGANDMQKQMEAMLRAMLAGSAGAGVTLPPLQ